MLKHTLIALTLLAAPAATLAQTDGKNATNFNLLPPVVATDPEFKDPTNAALLYYRAFMLYPDESSRKIADAISQTDPNWAPDTDICKLLAGSESAIYTFIRGSKLDTADFGVEYSTGIGALLPHLGKIRAGSRLLAVDARRAAREGKPDEAAERVAAIINMSRHTTQEHLLISSLVSVAIHNLGCVQAEYLMNNNLLTAKGKKMIADALDKFNTPDPWGVKGAIKGERYWVVVWIRGQIAQPDGLKVFTTQIMPLLDDKPDSADVKAINAMDLTAMNADLDKAEAFYAGILDAFDRPDAQQRLRALGERVPTGDFGIIGKHALPAMERAHAAHVKALARQADLRSKVNNFITPN